MTTTLGELYDLADRHLDESRKAVLELGHPADQVAAVRQLASLVGHLQRVHQITGVDRDPMTFQLTKGLTHARNLLAEVHWSLSRTPGARPPVTDPGGPLGDAAKTARTTIDLIQGHFDEGGASVTPTPTRFAVARPTSTSRPARPDSPRGSAAWWRRRPTERRARGFASVFMRRAGR